MFASLLYTESPFYGYVKTILFATNLIAFISPFLFYQFNVTKFSYYFLIQSFMFGVWFVILFPQIISHSAQLNLSDNSSLFGIYLGVGYVMGLSLLIVVFQDKIAIKNRLGAGLVIVIILILCGSRGPILFAIGLVCVFVLFRLFNSSYLHRIQYVKIHNVFIFSVTSTILSILLSVAASNMSQEVTTLYERSLFRLEFLILDDGMSVNPRVKYIEESIRYMSDRPFFGYGIGSYSYITTGIDQRGYPHNIILEVWFELGIIGLFALLFFLVGFFIKLIRDGQAIQWILYLYVLLNALKSSGLTDLRILFGILAMVALMQRTSQLKQQSVQDNIK